MGGALGRAQRLFEKALAKCACHERQVRSPPGGLFSAGVLQVLSYVNRTNVKSTSNCLC